MSPYFKSVGWQDKTPFEVFFGLDAFSAETSADVAFQA
jgi:hypothetical protein